MGGDSFAVAAEYEYYNTYWAYHGLDNTGWLGAQANNWYIFYNPNPLKVTKLTFSQISNNYIQKYDLYGSNDNSTYTKIGSYNQGSGTVSNDISNSIYYNYYKIQATSYVTRTAFCNLIITADEKYPTESTSSDYDFYKDVEIYDAQKKTVRHYYKYQYSSWTRPNLTSDGTLGGDSFACAGGNANPYLAFDGNTSTYLQIYTNAETTKTLYFYNPNPLKITSLTFSYYSGTQIQEATIYGSNDYSNWDEIISYTNNANPNTVTFPNNTLPYKYYKLYVIKAAGSAGYLGYILSDINEITFVAQERTAVESTSSDYDFYVDVDEYKAFNI